MARFKMACMVRLNSWEFKVGYKYITCYKGKKVMRKLELTPYVIGELEKIKKAYPADDARRTDAVIDYVVWHQTFDEEEE